MNVASWRRNRPLVLFLDDDIVPRPISSPRMPRATGRIPRPGRWWPRSFSPGRRRHRCRRALPHRWAEGVPRLPLQLDRAGLGRERDGGEPFRPPRVSALVGGFDENFVGWRTDSRRNSAGASAGTGAGPVPAQRPIQSFARRARRDAGSRRAPRVGLSRAWRRRLLFRADSRAGSRVVHVHPGPSGAEGLGTVLPAAAPGRSRSGCWVSSSHRSGASSRAPWAAIRSVRGTLETSLGSTVIFQRSMISR